MVTFDFDELNEMAAAYSDCPDKNARIDDDVAYLMEKLNEFATFEYTNGEIARVLNSFKLEFDSEDTRENYRAIKGVKSVDVAFIASQVGFVAGILHAENKRLNFFQR